MKLNKLIFILPLFLSACSHKESPNTIRVGTIAGPETTLMQTAKQVAQEKYHLHVKIIQFTDYNMPNQALADNNIDVNAFQHQPFLNSQIAQHHYDFVPVGKTFLYPMALYSTHLTSLSELKPNAKIAIPNDPSNEARALLLLQKAHLITLKPGVSVNAGLNGIASNPNHYQLIELNAAELPRTLSDVSVAAINTNYAIPAGLSPEKSLIEESTDSPYMNIFVAQQKNAKEKKIKELVKAYQSNAVREEARKIFGPGAIAGF